MAEFHAQQQNLPRVEQEKPAAKRKSTPLKSLIAGCSAGAIEIAITYPFEFAKTRSQLNRHLPAAQKLPWPPFPSKQWYTGCTTLIVGNALKAGVRFVAFDQIKAALGGDTSTTSTILAGLGAGVAESAFAVTPFESIKTQLIDDKKSPRPRMNGFIHGSMIIAKEKGLRGFFQGFWPTTARQAANSGVRFTSYATIKRFAERRLSPGEKLGSLGNFFTGAAAGIITVYATMPLDVIKTRMQSLDSSRMYKNSFDCATLILRTEGLRTFWSGSTARLGRLSLSGGIVFAMYDKTLDVLDVIDPAGRYL